MRSYSKQIAHLCYHRWTIYGRLNGIIAALLLSLVGLILYWQYFDTRTPIEYHNEPFPVVWNSTGTSVRLLQSFTKYTDKGFDAANVLKIKDDGQLFLSSSGRIAGNAPGSTLEQLSFPIALPVGSMTYSDRYRIETNVCYQINPLRQRCVQTVSEWFTLP